MAKVKRCKSISPHLAMRCLKERGHEERELDVVHKMGMFIWRNGRMRVGERQLDDLADAVLDDKPITLSPESQLTEWWMQQAEDEVARTVPKAVEYGATDLIDIGRELADLLGREVDDEEAAELGVFFYQLGKMSRWRSAIKRGARVSDDSLFDIGVYIRMVQRIREFGSWPGAEEQD